jgi:hypothetical protein
LTIRKPDDWHLHVRDNETLKAVLPFTARHFGRAILMPNLVPPVRTTADAIAYRERVMRTLPPGRRTWTVPEHVQVEGPDERAAVHRGGEILQWQVVSN